MAVVVDRVKVVLLDEGTIEVLPGGPTPGAPSSGLAGEQNVAMLAQQSTSAPTGTGLGAPPQGELAHTGADGVGVLAGMAGALVAAGAGLVAAGRHEKRDEDESSDAAE